MYGIGGIFEGDTPSANTDNSSIVGVGATPDEVSQIVDDAIAAYEARQYEYYEAAHEQTNNQLVEIQTAADDNNGLLVALADDVAKTSTGVVVISDNQWKTMQECWGWAKNCAAVALFLVLVATLLVAGLFGSKLWDHFSKGWRH